MRIVTKGEDRLRDREIQRLAEDKQAMNEALTQLNVSLRIAQADAESLKRETAVQTALRHAETEANKVLQVNLDWFRFRLAQLEKERAQLMFLHTGVKLEVPEVVTQKENEPVSTLDILRGLPDFEDVGDEEAGRLGIRWDDEGKVAYDSGDKD